MSAFSSKVTFMAMNLNDSNVAVAALTMRGRFTVLNLEFKTGKTSFSNIHGNK